MQHKQSDNNAQTLTFIQISKYDRPEYDALIGHVTRSSMLADMEESARPFLRHLPNILKSIDPRTRQENLSYIDLDTNSAENFYLYAIEGIPRFLMEPKGGDLRELDEEQLEAMNFRDVEGAFLSYNELFTCFEDSWNATRTANSLNVVLNTFAARIKLDAAMITGVPNQLSIHEVALLAGMKEKSVRNLAHKEIGAAFNSATGSTWIASDKALRWLKARRKFTPSVPLKTEAACRKLVEIAVEVFGA